jgi:RNA-dependent RNA polymerase
MSCRFTTCLDSRKTGHHVRQNVLAQDTKQYGWPLPECMQYVETDEWSQRHYVRRKKALGPFILDSLWSFGRHVADGFLGEYDNLGGQCKFIAQDHNLLGPHQQVVKKLSGVVLLPYTDIGNIIQEARGELRMIEDHIDKMKAEWSSLLTTKKKSGSTSTQNLAIAALRQEFASGPDVPHLSLLGDIPAICASYAYTQCRANNPNFAFSMAFEELCKMKAQESGGIMLSYELAELMTIPKTAVRTLSAIRSLT